MWPLLRKHTKETIIIGGSVASILGLVVTMYFMGLPRWLDGSRDGTSAALVSESPAPPAPISPTPASPILSTIPASLKQLLEVADSVRWSENHAQTMRDVAEHAVGQGHYEIAIKAGAGIRWSAQKSETLKFVAICAAKEGLFGVANKAASRIPYTKVHDDAKAEIIKLERQRQKEQSEPRMMGQRPANRLPSMNDTSVLLQY